MVGAARGPDSMICGTPLPCTAWPSWYRDGADLQAKLPVLATYMGHRNLSGTQQYLQLTAELFPDLSTRLDAAYGECIPRRTQP